MVQTGHCYVICYVSSLILSWSASSTLA
jgi:hypothetical protein